MEIKTGVDIIEVDRVKEAIERQKEQFLEKIFTKKEVEYCSNTGKMEYQHYAVIFAAKEAIFKAISSKLPDTTKDIWNLIEITHKDSGKPIVNIEKLNLSKILSMDLSLSHIKEYAVATFTILFE